MGSHQPKGRAGPFHHHHSLASPVETLTALEGNFDGLRNPELSFRELKYVVAAGHGMLNGLRIVGLPVACCSKIAYVTHSFTPGWLYLRDRS